MKSHEIIKGKELMGKELIKAVLNKDDKLLKKILDSKDITIINYQDKAGFTALHFAIQENQYDYAVQLIEAGADFEIADMYGNTAIIRAVSSFKGDGRIIKLLLSKGADINKENNYGVSAIEWAKNVANYDIISLFK